MFFILSELYLSGMFLMKRGCLPGHLSRGWNPRQGANPLYRQDRHFFARQQALPSSRATRPFSRPWRRQEEGGFLSLVSSLCCRGYYQNGPQERALGLVVKRAR